jgi:hypothetical protein
MRKIIASVVVAVFFAAGSPSYAQFGAVKDGANKAGEATVDSTKNGVEATEKGTKKVAKGTKDAVQTTYACNDGKTDQATVKKNACKASRLSKKPSRSTEADSYQAGRATN